VQGEWQCVCHAEGQPDADAEGKPEAAGVKPGEGSATDPTDGITARWAGVKAPPYRLRPTVQRKAVSFGS